MARYMTDMNKVLFIYESGTYAVASGTGHWIGQVNSNNIDENLNITPTRVMGTGDRNVDYITEGQNDYTGTLNYYPQDWKFLQFAFGLGSDAGSPSPYTHTITEWNTGSMNGYTSGTENPFFSITIEDSKTVPGTGLNFIRTMKGCCINNYTINASAGDVFVSCDAEYIAKEVAFSSGASTDVTVDTSRAFVFSDVKVYMPSGAMLDTLKSMTFSINNNMEGTHYLNGSNVILQPLPQGRDYELSVTIDSKSETTKQYYDQYFLGGSEFNVTLNIDASTGSRDLFIFMSGCKIIDMENPSANEGMNEQTITIKPKSATCLVNDLTQYYNPW